MFIFPLPLSVVLYFALQRFVSVVFFDAGGGLIFLAVEIFPPFCFLLFVRNLQLLFFDGGKSRFMLKLRKQIEIKVKMN